MAKEVIANMSGNVFKVLVNVGDSINKGDHVIILESMKMEIPIITEEGGTVKDIKVSEGEFLQEGSIVAVIE